MAESDFVEDLKEAFGMFDKENTGLLNREGFGNVVRSLGLNPTDHDLNEIMSGVDGGTGNVTVEQLITGANKVKEKIGTDNQQTALAEAFKVFDKGGEGTIPGAEIRHMITNVMPMEEDDLDELMAEIEEDSGHVSIQKLSELMFVPIDTKPAERREYHARMAEIKAYLAAKPNAGGAEQPAAAAE